ncbi:MAG TPA: hypothetical protein VEZ14_05215 [Dehalococcoidia bacterium]|nr:hypothetical protein [Dehalococcoidia bacterium]
MAGRKFAMMIMARTPASYHGLSAAEQAKPGKVMQQVMKKYAGKVDLVRHYWTGTFSADVTDVLVLESDDLTVMHACREEMDRGLVKAGGGVADKFGSTVEIMVGINPDASAPARKRGTR